MDKKEPIIELEPKGQFSWKVFGLLFGGWIGILLLALLIKSSMLRILLPVVAVIMVVYLGVCTLNFLRSRK